jgi:hypothetical protein
MIYTKSIYHVEKVDQCAQKECPENKNAGLTGSNRLLMAYIFGAIHYLYPLCELPLAVN